MHDGYWEVQKSVQMERGTRVHRGGEDKEMKRKIEQKEEMETKPL